MLTRLKRRGRDGFSNLSGFFIRDRRLAFFLPVAVFVGTSPMCGGDPWFKRLKRVLPSCGEYPEATLVPVQDPFRENLFDISSAVTRATHAADEGKLQPGFGPDQSTSRGIF